MKIVPIVNILHDNAIVNSLVTICGWVRTRRDSKIGISFLNIYDGSCFKSIQVIISNDLPNYNDCILHLTTGCSVSVTGKVVISPSKTQRLEILATKLDIIGWVENPDSYPIAAKYHSVEYLREVAHLRPRTNLIGAISRIRHTLLQALHRFFNEKGYFWISTPIITSSNTEGISKMFRVSTLDIENIPRTPEGRVIYDQDFFGKESFLTVSGQLNGEAYACALSKIYTFGPIFRAENSNTSRHLAEFWMLEPEVAFANLDDIICLAREMLQYVFKTVQKERVDDINFFIEQVDSSIIKRMEYFTATNLIQIDYTEAISILEKSHESFNNTIYWGVDLSIEHERYLVDKYFKAPVILKNYPKEIKAFYMRLNDDNKTVAAMDILVPGIGEIIGGSQREERLDVLDERMISIGLNINDYWWYRDLRKYGTVPHSGFGLGFERLISYITGVKNVRDVIPFPRVPGNVEF